MNANAMLTLDEAFELAKKDIELGDKLCKYVDKRLKAIEFHKNQARACNYAGFINRSNREPNPIFIEKYKLRQLDDGRWKSGFQIKSN